MKGPKAVVVLGLFFYICVMFDQEPPKIPDDIELTLVNQRIEHAFDPMSKVFEQELPELNSFYKSILSKLEKKSRIELYNTFCQNIEFNNFLKDLIMKNIDFLNAPNISTKSKKNASDIYRSLNGINLLIKNTLLKENEHILFNQMYEVNKSNIVEDNMTPIMTKVHKKVKAHVLRNKALIKECFRVANSSGILDYKFVIDDEDSAAKFSTIMRFFDTYRFSSLEKKVPVYFGNTTPLTENYYFEYAEKVW